MLPYLTFALVVVGLRTADTFAPQVMPRWLVTLRYVVTVTATVAAVTFLVIKQAPPFPTVLADVLAIVPFMLVFHSTLFRVRYNILAVTGALLVVGAILFALAASSQTLFEVQRGDVPMLLVPALCCGIAAILFLLNPETYYRRTKFRRGLPKLAMLVTLFSAPVAVAAWFGATQVIMIKARAAATDAEWCLRLPDNSVFQSTRWISPHTMFFKRQDTGSTLPYLVLRTNRSDWTHHWSFWAIDFVEHETPAFSLVRSGARPTEPGECY